MASAVAGIIDTRTFTDRICAAIESDWPNTKAAVNEIADMTGSSVETVKNWFKRKCAPSAANVVLLMRRSPSVRQAVFEFALLDDLASRQKEIIERVERVEAALRGDMDGRP